MFSNIKADLKRMISDEGELRSKWNIAISALLSQGFQAILAYRFARWCMQGIFLFNH